jgi:hypothetical protein
MIRIETSERGDFVTFVLSDWIQKEDLGVLKSLVDKQKKAVVLDLKGCEACRSRRSEISGEF